MANIFTDSRVLNRFPFVRILIPFIAGILMSESLGIPRKIIIVLIILFFIGIILLNIFITYNVQWLWGIFVSCFIFLTGLFLMSIRLDCNDQFILPQKEVIIKGYLEKNLVIKENSYQSVFVISPLENSWIPKKKIRMLVYFEKDSFLNSLKAGDLLEIKSHIKKIKNKGNPGEFDYEKYMAIKGIYHYFFASIDKITKTGIKKNNLYIISENIRYYLLQILKNYISDQEKFSVVSALVLGYKEELNPETRLTFTNSGAQHILAVSGLHVGIIYLILTYILFPIDKISPLIRLLLIIIMLWFYAILTGLSPSVTRATTMFCLIAIGKHIKKKVENFNILAFTAFIFLLINPLQLYNISFQLSFLALGSLMFFYPYIYTWYEAPNRILHELWKITAVSLSVQIGIFPILIYNFHQFPVYFLFTNIIVIYLATLVIFMSFVLLIFSFTSFVNFLGILLSKIIGILLYSVKLIASLPYSTINDIHISNSIVLVIYFIMGCFIMFLMLKRTLYLKSVLILLIVLFMLFTFSKMKSIKQKKIVVYNMNQITVCDFIYGRKSVLFKSDSLTDYAVKIIKNNHGLQNIRGKKLINNNISEYENGFLKYFGDGIIDFSGVNILLLSTENQKKALTVQDLNFTYIIITNDLYINPDEIKSKYKKIIIAPANIFKTKKKWKNISNRYPYKVHIIKNNGAFVEEIKL